MGSSGTSLARSAVAHGERRSGLLERITGGGRSPETGRFLMSGKVGSRLFLSGSSRCLAMSARKWFRRLPWWKSGRLAVVEIPIVFPVLLVGRELVLHDVHSMETTICVDSVLFVSMLFAAHYKFCL